MTLTELKRLVDFAFDQHNGSRGFGSDNVYIKIVDDPSNPKKLYDVQQLAFNIDNSARVPTIAIFPDNVIQEVVAEEPKIVTTKSESGHLVAVDNSEIPVKRKIGRPAKPKVYAPKRPPGRPKKESQEPKLEHYEHQDQPPTEQIQQSQISEYFTRTSGS